MHEEKPECIMEYEQKQLILSDEKCKKCDCYYKCCFMLWEMNSVIDGD